MFSGGYSIQYNFRNRWYDSTTVRVRRLAKYYVPINVKPHFPLDPPPRHNLVTSLYQSCSGGMLQMYILLHCGLQLKWVLTKNDSASDNIHSHFKNDHGLDNGKAIYQCSMVRQRCQCSYGVFSLSPEHS